jgi:hypothetical protein
LDVLDYDELKEIINKIHFDAFGKTIEERRQSESQAMSADDAEMAIPTFIRQGIVLEDTLFAAACRSRRQYQ